MDRTVWFQHSRMRLQQPDDTIGGKLFLALPSVVVHQLDAWSPFAPPETWDETRRQLRVHGDDARHHPVTLRNRFATGPRPGAGAGGGGVGGGGDGAAGEGNNADGGGGGGGDDDALPPLHGAPHDPMRGYQFPDVLLREADAVDGSRSGSVCQVCGNAYRSEVELRRHQVRACCFSFPASRQECACVRVRMQWVCAGGEESPRGW
jgi:hypothetical protein